MLNHETCLRSHGNTQAQGRHGRETARGTQGLLGTHITRNAARATSVHPELVQHRPDSRPPQPGTRNDGPRYDVTLRTQTASRPHRPDR